MFGVLAQILGSKDVIKKGLDLVDDMHTSDEESIKAATQQKVEIMKAYAPFKIAQRYLALMFTFTFLASFVLTIGMALSGYGDIDAVKQILGDFYLGEICLIIVTFYFGGGLAEGVLDKRKK